MIIEGKNAVLNYLERESAEVDRYALISDDSGNLVVILAGHAFIGQPTLERLITLCELPTR